MVAVKGSGAGFGLAIAGNLIILRVLAAVEDSAGCFLADTIRGIATSVCWSESYLTPTTRLPTNSLRDFGKTRYETYFSSTKPTVPKSFFVPVGSCLSESTRC